MAQTPAIFYADGDMIDYTPGSAVIAGQVVLIDTVPCIAPMAVAANVKGQLAVGGIWEVPQKAEICTAGDAIYWDEDGTPVLGTAASGAATETAAAGNCMGKCVEDTTAADSYVKVLLNQFLQVATTLGSCTANDITGTDSSLGILGAEANQGGAVAVTGGTSAVTGNAGGAVSMTGGTGGLTGAGGAASVVGGVSGATSGTGGAAALTGGAAGSAAGNAVGGAAAVAGGAGKGNLAGGAVSVTGGTGGATGAGGAVTVTGGTPGATSGTGGAVTVTGGGYAAGTNHTGGAVGAVGGAGKGSGDGGAASVTGGVAGATGAGGAIAITGGAGGATSGAGGAVTIASGAAGNAAGSAGALTIDTGAANGGTGAGIIIGGTNATTITLGKMPRIPVVAVTAVAGCTAINNAIALSEGFCIVAAADDTAAVILPVAVAGRSSDCEEHYRGQEPDRFPAGRVHDQ